MKKSKIIKSTKPKFSAKPATIDSILKKQETTQQEIIRHPLEEGLKRFWLW